MPPKAQSTATGAAPSGDPAVVGGPGGDPTGSPVQPQGIEVTLNGRQFMVSPEIADAMGVRDRQIDAKLSENSRELGELRKLKPAPDPNPNPNPDPDPQPPSRGDRFFEDPDAVLNERDKALEERIVTRVTTAYTRDKAQNDFWNDLYKANTDLDRATDHTLVRGIMQDNYAEIEHMNTPEAITKIADLTRQRILSMSRRMKATSPSEPSRTVVEPTGGPTGSPPAPNAEERPTSLGGVIKKRQQNRAAARAGKTA